METAIQKIYDAAILEIYNSPTINRLMNDANLDEFIS